MAMLPDLTIRPLRDCPEALARLAAAFRAEWPDWYGPGGPGDAASDLAAFANPEGALPVGLVALDPAGTPLGTASGDECQIDALVQAWAALSGAVAPERIP